MPPRRKRIRSDDSENSTLESRGPSSGSDIQNPLNGKNIRNQSKRVSSEDYDGDCELECPGKDRVIRTATRSRVLRQKLTNSLHSDGSSSTPVSKMEVDPDYLGFEKLTSPINISPVSCGHLVGTPNTLTPAVISRQIVEPAVTMTPKPLFETPVEKPIKKCKRKRVGKNRQGRTKVMNEEEALMVAHFEEIDKHELLIE